LVVKAYQLVARGDQARPRVEAPQVDHTQPLHAERAKVGRDLGTQLRWLLSGDEHAVGGTLGAGLGDQDQVVGVRRQGRPDEGVGLPVELSGVDVVDARADRLAQDVGSRFRLSFQLHRAEADPGDDVPCQLRGTTGSRHE
jgi:hypothetical protein